MRIASITYEEFGPFAGKQVLELGTGLHMIIGPNGAGKSVAMLAIPYALYGTIPGTTPEQLVHEGADHMAVHLRLTDGTEISRGWDCRGKGSGWVKMTGVEDARAADAVKAFTERSGMSAEDFRSTVFLGAGDPGKLITSGASARRDQLGAWVVPALWGQLADKAEARSGALQKRVQAAQASLRALSPEDPADLRERLQGVQDARAEVVTRSATPEAIREAERQKGLARAAHERRNELRRLEAREPPLPGDPPTATDPPVPEDPPIMGDPPVPPDPPTPPDLAKMPDPPVADRERLGSWRAQQAKFEELARGWFDGPCPVDKVACPRADEIRDDIKGHCRKAAEGRKAIDMLAAKVRAVDAKISTHRQAEQDHVQAMAKHERDCAKAWNDHRRAHDQAVADHARAHDRAVFDHEQRHAAAMARHAQAHDTHQAWWDSIERLMDAAPIPDVDVAALRRGCGERVDLSGFDREIGEIESKIERATMEAERVSELDAELSDIEPQLIAWRWFERACGREGVPAMLLDSAIGEIAQEGNAVLEAAGASIRFEFRLRRELKKPADRCRCGYVFAPRKRKCEDCGQPRGLQLDHDCTPLVRDMTTGDVVREYKSTGQRGMVTIGLRIGSAAWRMRRVGCTWSTLILDEAENGLSDENAAAAREVVRAAPALGFDQQLMVSHRAASRLTGQRVIRVIPEGKYSSLVID